MDSAPNLQAKALDQFVDSLIDQKGFPDLSSEVREEIKRDLLERVDSFITGKLIAALSDDDIAAFEHLLNEEKSQEELQKFIQDHVPNTTDLVTEALTEFKGVYLGTIPSPQ